MDYYKVKHMDSPSLAMYGLNRTDKILMIGCAQRYDWAFTVDIDKNAPCDLIADGACLPFGENQFDVCILDFTTNFMKPSHVKDVISEANRVSKRVMGRCHISNCPKTLKGAKQAFCHLEIPGGVEWIELRVH